MIKKIKLPKVDPRSGDDFYDGQMEGYVAALSLVAEHIRQLKDIYLGQPEKVVVLERLENRIAEDTK